jgi:ankyrin repeat protein
MMKMEKLKSILIAVFLLLSVSQNLKSQEIFDAIRNGDIGKVKELVENDPQLVKARNARQFTPLHVAADVNNENIVSYLLEKGADPDAKGNNDWTPLLYAKNIGIAKLLVNNGADVNEGMPIAWALVNRRKEIVDYLIDMGAKLPEVKTSQGLLFLVRSLRCGSDKILKIYLQQGFDLLYESKSKNNLLHYASESNSSELIDQLIGDGVQANKTNIFGWTPLHIAAASGNLEVVKSLLKSGVDLNVRTNDGKTPFNLAADANNDETAEYLKSIGADRSPQKFPVLEGEYMGQPKPGSKAVLFAPGILDPGYEYHGAIVFSTDGNEMYWSAYVDDKGASVLRSQCVNGKWEKPEVYIRGDVPFISPDGNKFYYVAFKQVEGGTKEVIYISEKTTSGWSVAKEMPEMINSVAQVHWQASVDKIGNLYFGASQDKGSRIYYSALLEGEYTKPQVINAFKDIEAFSPYIAPDGSYLIFTTVEEGENLIISFKKRDGTWTEGIDLSNYIGIKGAFCPIVTHDGKYLFFVCSIDGQYANFWVEASFLEDLRPEE